MLFLLLFSLLNFARFIFSYILFAVVLEFLLCVRVFFAPSLALSFAYFYFHFILMFTFIAFFLHQFIQLFFFALFPQYWASEVSIFFCISDYRHVVWCSTLHFDYIHLTQKLLFTEWYLAGYDGYWYTHAHTRIMKINTNHQQFINIVSIRFSPRQINSKNYMKSYLIVVKRCFVHLFAFASLVKAHPTDGENMCIFSYIYICQ